MEKIGQFLNKIVNQYTSTNISNLLNQEESLPYRNIYIRFLKKRNQRIKSKQSLFQSLKPLK